MLKAHSPELQGVAPQAQAPWFFLHLLLLSQLRPLGLLHLLGLFQEPQPPQPPPQASYLRLMESNTTVTELYFPQLSKHPQPPLLIAMPWAWFILLHPSLMSLFWLLAALTLNSQEWIYWLRPPAHLDDFTSVCQLTLWNNLLLIALKVLKDSSLILSIWHPIQLSDLTFLAMAAAFLHARKGL